MHSGDRVEMTEQSRAKFRSPYTGVVVGESRYPAMVRVRRDGRKTVELWGRCHWRVVEKVHECHR